MRRIAYRVRRREIVEDLSAFELLAELSLALAGFAGVAAAFGGRAREYGKVDLNRLMTLFACAGFVVVGCLAVIILAALDFEPSTTFVSVGAASAVTIAVAVFPLIRAYIRNNREAPEKAPLFVLIIGMLVFVACEFLLVLNLFQGGKSGLLLAAFSLPLVYGLWIFARLMTRPS